jgi:hypothetical protein
MFDREPTFQAMRASSLAANYAESGECPPDETQKLATLSAVTRATKFVASAHLVDLRSSRSPAPRPQFNSGLGPRSGSGWPDGAQGITLLCRRRAHEIALADLDAALPDDVVGGSGVKPEIGQTIAKQ